MGRNKYGRSGKARQIGTFKTGGGGIYLSDGIKDVDAWHVLTPSARLVLHEMLSTYMHASRFDTENISASGFTFPLAYCRELVDGKTFSEARREIVRVGWFDAPAGLQSLSPGAPTVYAPSQRWRRYAPTPKEAETLRRKRASRESRFRRDRKRRTECRARIKTERGGRNSVDTPGRNSVDTSKGGRATPRKISVDTSPKTGGSIG